MKFNGSLISLGTASTVNVFFEYGTTVNYGSTTAFQSLTAAGSGTFNAAISGLVPGTLYHFRASAAGGINGSASGPDLTFTTLTPPILGLPHASNVTVNSATLNGDIISMGSATLVYVYFEYGTTTEYGSTTPLQPMNAPGIFTADISGLNPGTLYHFRERADAGASGPAVGPDVTFTTIHISPGVSTSPAGAVTTGSAKLNGLLAALGTASTVNVYFEYGTTAAYGTSTPLQSMTSQGSFSADLLGLSPGITYHYRANADGGAQGLSNGDDMTFTTINIPPGVSTIPVTGLTTNSVVLNGNLASLGTAASVDVSFDYGTTVSYGHSTAPQARSQAGAFSDNLTGLLPGTIYHFRARADGAGQGISTGDDLTFTTATTPPEVVTSAASNITLTGATLNGNLASLGTAAAVNVSFEYGLTASYGHTIAVQVMSGAGAFSVNLSSLDPGKTYHFRAQADGQGASAGSDLTFTTLTPSAVETLAVSSLTSNSVKLNGNLLSLGSVSSDNVSFEYGLTASYGNSTESRSLTLAGQFSADLSGLNSSTVYHFRARADGGINGVATGADMTFTTLTPPSVTTYAADNVTFNSVTLFGDLYSLGTAAADNVSFEYGTSIGYGSTTVPQAKSQAGIYSHNLTGLVPATTYHFRAKADGGVNGLATGADMTFTTLTPPSVNTNAALSYSADNQTFITLNGYLVSSGTAVAVAVVFQYGLTTDYENTTAPQTLSYAGAFSDNLTGLTPGTLYHYRARADGGLNGIYIGPDMTFTTANAGTIPPQVVASTATATITNLVTSAVLTGDLTSLGSSGNVKVSFEYGLTDAYGQTTAVRELSAAGSFSINISGLLAGTTYHFKAHADGGINGASGSTDMIFTTPTIAPTVSTSTPTSIGGTAVTVNGNLNSLGTASSVAVSFDYGLSVNDNHVAVQTLTAPGAFSFNLAGLVAQTTYHFRARADGGIHGVAVGDNLTFTTADPGAIAPQITTLAAGSITTSTASLNGNLVSLGNAGADNVSFEYGTTLSYGSSTTPRTLTLAGAFSDNLTGLLSSTTYHFRTVARGIDNSTAFGTDLQFTTLNYPGGGNTGGSYAPPKPTPTPTPVIPALIEGAGSVDISKVVSDNGTINAQVTLRSDDGQAWLKLAKGTVAHNRDGSIISALTVARFQTSTLPSPLSNTTVLPIGYDFGPSGAVFDPALSLTLHFDPLSLPGGSQWLIGYYDAALHNWVYLPDFSVNSLDNTITVAVSHFTVFALLIKSPELMPTVTPTVTPTPPQPTPVVTPTSTTPAVVVTPTVAPTKKPIPGTIPPAPKKGIDNRWLIIAIIALILIGVFSYWLYKRKKGPARMADSSPANKLYSGSVKLIIRVPAESNQLPLLEDALRKSPDLKVESVGGSSEEGNVIIISIDKQKPILLIDVLKSMSPVKQVVTENNRIVVIL